ncbi:MAG: SGNH/GDSL hydrolase family protein [Bacteroidetes bacterium]|nr:SGNH/GDSL hydrolase family protein [Bacteroidota bacterium]
MLNLFSRITLVISVLFLLAGEARANDSDVVNCNHVWTVAILGSSTAYGTGASVLDSSWAAKFTAYLQRKNVNNVVYNLGIPGFTTYQNLCPTGFVPPANRPSPNSGFNITAALNLHPDAIIINMPSNDAANDYSLAEQQANFERAMHLADSANVPVWVTTTQPRNNMTSTQINNLTLMRDWILGRFGDKAVDFWTTIANADGSINTFYDFDYVHVNNFGHDLFYKRIKAETILDSLCARNVQTLVARAGNDITVTLPTNSTSLNGSASFSSLGGIITGYSWTVISNPVGFAPTIVSPTSVTTAVNGLVEGRYSFKLTVTDNASNVKSDTVDVVVASRILIDFGPDVTTSPDAFGHYWNTISDATAGVKLSNALTVGNTATAIGLTVINRIDGTFNISGPGTNNGNTTGVIGDYPASATEDFAFAHPTATNGQWRITGLESTKQYTIKFWGTRSVADDRIIQIKRADQSTWQEYNTTNNINFNTSATFTFTGKTQMTFDIRVKAGSAFGYISLIDITRTSPAVAVNVPPTALASDVTVSIPATSGVLDGSLSSDDDGSIVSYAWTQTSGPSTAQIVTPNAAITNVNNLVEGTYTFHLVVTDDSSAVAATDMTLTVNTRVLFDIGPTSTTGPDAGGKYWNNIADGLPGVKVNNAIVTGNIPTTIGLSIINRIDGTFNIAGPGTNTGNSVGDLGDYPSTATADYAFAHPTATNGQWKLTGLDSLKQYTVKFWGSRTGIGDQRYLQIKRADETTYQQYDAANNTDYNNAAVFVFSGKTEMTFDIKVRDGDAFGYISIIDIKIITAPVICTPSLAITASPSGAVCSGSSVTFTATPTRGGTAPTYQWKKNGVNISGATGSTYTTTLLLNNDVISCAMVANTDCAQGTTATSNTITANILPIVGKAGTISGPTDVCPFIGSTNNAVYSIAPLANATTYNWVVPAGATIVSGQGTTSITVSFNSNFATTDTIKVSGGICTNSAPSKLVITKVIPAIPGAISGPTDVCPLIDQAPTAVYSIAAVANATGYTWTVPIGANIISGQGTTSILVGYTNSFISGAIKVTADANCGSRAPRSLTVSKVVPAAPASITGPNNACQYLGTATQVVYSINAVANATSYSWTIPTGMTLVSGQGTTSITVTFGLNFTTASLKVKSVSNCSVSGDRSLSITTTTSSTPGAITGPTNACAFIGSTDVATYTIRKVSNASAYIWTVPAGATITAHPGGAGINDTIITVAYDNNFVSATSIQVQSGGCVPSAARSLSVLRTGVPSTPGTITGATNPCEFLGTSNPVTYKIAKVANANAYTWTTPAGTTVTHPAGTGANDTIINVVYPNGFVSGSIAVLASNGCGNNGVAKTLSIKTLVPSTTPTITGPTDPCVWIGTSGAIYTIKKITNATSYTWTVPSVGATVTHPNGPGINDTIIIVDFTPAFTTGTITARADANCGSSSTRTLTLTRKLPSTPGAITAAVLSACPNRIYTYTIAAMPTNATSVTWSVPAGGTIIDGQGTLSITVSYTQAAITGSVSAIGNNNCGNGSTARNLTINLPACVLGKTTDFAGRGNTENATSVTPTETAADALDVKVLPNPSYSDFKVIVLSNDKTTPVTLRLADISSKMIEVRKGIVPGQTISVGSSYMKGIYVAELIQGDKRKVIKLIKL